MKADLSRDTFDPSKQFLRVLQQQGRVQLDADANEQASILLNLLQSLGNDAIGPHRCFRGGFQVDAGAAGMTLDKVLVKAGRCYVGGMLCENPSDRPLLELQDHPPSADVALETGKYLVYLDAWEHHVTYVEDDGIREKALNGPDTATRSKLVWQVRVIKTDLTAADAKKELKNSPNAYLNFTKKLVKPSNARLTAMLDVAGDADKELCALPGESHYRGPENQLYRVEIHQGGDASQATWKWSRDNGSVVFPLADSDSIKTDGETITVTLEHFGRDQRFGLKINDWVELVDDDNPLGFRSGELLQVKELRENDRRVVLDRKVAGNVGISLAKHPLLRRWDQKPPAAVRLVGELKVKEGEVAELEYGIHCRFEKPEPNGAGAPLPRIYEQGDYWLIPARATTGKIEWPVIEKKPQPLPTKGIKHYFAPLAHLDIANGIATATDLRRDASTEVHTLSLVPTLTKWEVLDGKCSTKPPGGANATTGYMPVTLPDNARLIRLRVRGLRKTGATELTIKLKRDGVIPQNLPTDVVAPIDAPVDNAFSVDEPVKPDPGLDVVDNANFRYFIEVTGKGNVEIWSLQIDYVSI